MRKITITRKKKIVGKFAKIYCILDASEYDFAVIKDEITRANEADSPFDRKVMENIKTFVIRNGKSTEIEIDENSHTLIACHVYTVPRRSVASRLVTHLYLSDQLQIEEGNHDVVFSVEFSGGSRDISIILERK